MFDHNYIIGLITTQYPFFTYMGDGMLHLDDNGTMISYSIMIKSFAYSSDGSGESYVYRGIMTDAFEIQLRVKCTISDSPYGFFMFYYDTTTKTVRCDYRGISLRTIDYCSTMSTSFYYMLFDYGIDIRNRKYINDDIDKIHRAWTIENIINN